MSPEKVWAALGRYDRELASHGVAAVQFSAAEYDAKGDDLSKRVVLAHCRWMAKKCLTVFRPEFEAARATAAAGGLGITRCVELMEEAFKPLGKAMRWLSYIQGACHVIGLYTCNELRDHSRGGEGEFKPAAEEHGVPGVLGWDGLVRPPGVEPPTVIPYEDRGEEPGVMAVGPSHVPLAIRNVFLDVAEAYGPEIDAMSAAASCPDRAARHAAARAAVVASLDARRAAVVAALDACFCTDQHNPGAECADCVALREELTELDAGSN